MNLPNFLVIANKRCGTSWLNYNLGSHSDIYMPPQKGVHFFDKNFDKGLSHYSVYFSEAGDEKRIGETEHSYFWNDSVPQRISISLGVIPMLLSLRQPVERAYSYYQLQLRKGTRRYSKNVNFEKACMQSMIHNYDMTAWGFYGLQFKKYLKYFPLETFHIIRFEEINSEPLKTIHAAYDFLGVDPAFEPLLLNHKWTQASNIPENTGKLKANLMCTSWPARMSRRVLNRIGMKSVPFYHAFSPLPLEPGVKRRLTRFYDDDIKLLMDLTGKDFSSWLSSEQ